MNDGKIIGVNEIKMDILISELNSYVESINKNLNNIELKVDDTEKFFTCEQGLEFRKKFYSFSSNFPILKKNILNISNDLINVKNGMYNVQSRSVLNMKDKIRDMNK